MTRAPRRSGIVEDAIRSARAMSRPVKPGMCECRSGLKAGACTHELGRVHPSRFPCRDRHTNDPGPVSQHEGLRRWAQGWKASPCPVCRRLCVFTRPGPDGHPGINAFRAERLAAGDVEAVALVDRARVNDDEEALHDLTILMEPRPDA